MRRCLRGGCQGSTMGSGWRASLRRAADRRRSLSLSKGRHVSVRSCPCPGGSRVDSAQTHRLSSGKVLLRRMGRAPPIDSAQAHPRSGPCVLSRRVDVYFPFDKLRGRRGSVGLEAYV